MQHLKNHYGQVYMILNKINNKKYIGQTIGENVLLDRYKNNIEKNTFNNHLKSSISKYGFENFEISTLCFCDSKEELNSKEQYYIEQFNTINPAYGYNQHVGGCGGKHIDSIQKEINTKCKMFWDAHPEYKERMSLLMSGDNNPMHIKGGHSIESCRKMSETKKLKIQNGEIDLSKARALSLTPEAIEKRVHSASKFIYVQYDTNMNEVMSWYTLKEMYNYLSQHNLTHYKTYGGFKLKTSKKVVFDGLYYGYYYKTINKEEYINAC